MNETTLKCPDCGDAASPCGFDSTSEILYCETCAQGRSDRGEGFFPLLINAPLPSGGSWAGSVIRVREGDDQGDYLACYRGACDARAHACGYNRVTHGLYCRSCSGQINRGSDREYGGEFYPLIRQARPIRRLGIRLTED